MRPITDLFARPVAVTLGGEEFLVGELTIGDVVDLQAWLDSRSDPLAGVRPYLFADLVAPEHRHLFSEAADRVEEGPITWGSGRAWRELATVEGLFTFLRLVLSRYQPGLTADRLIDVMGRIESAEMDELRRAVHRPDPEWILGSAIDRLAGVESPRVEARPHRWYEWVDRVAQAHGIGYEQVERMTLTAFYNAVAGGKEPDSGGRAPYPGEDLEATAARRAAWLAGEG